MNLGMRYVPDYRLTIGGEPAPSELRASITSITHESGLEGSDRVEIGLANENLRWLDHELLKLGKNLSLDIGYADGEMKRVFIGEIVAHSANFSAGTPTISLTAQDRMHKLQKGKKTRWMGFPIPFLQLYPLTDMVVSSIVALENGLIPEPDPLGSLLSVILSLSDMAAGPKDGQKLIRKIQSENDFDFLTRLAKENGWELTVDHKGPLGGYILRFFSPSSNLSSDVTVKYGESLIDFSPRISDVGQTTMKSTRVPVAESKLEFVISVGWDWNRSMLTLSLYPQLGPADMFLQAEKAARELKDEDEGEQAESTDEEDEPLTLLSAPRYLISELIPQLNNRLTAIGSSVGNPDIIAGKVMRIEGVGEQFGGLYRIKSATHTIDSSGFQTRFELQKEIWFNTIPLIEQGAVSVDTGTTILQNQIENVTNSIL